MSKVQVKKENVKEAYKNLHAGALKNVRAEGSWYKIIEVEMPDGSEKAIPTGRFVNCPIDHPIHRVGWKKHWKEAELRTDLTQIGFFPGQGKFENIEIEYI